jgi:hypothetical protein
LGEAKTEVKFRDTDRYIRGKTVGGYKMTFLQGLAAKGREAVDFCYGIQVGRRCYFRLQDVKVEWSPIGKMPNQADGREADRLAQTALLHWKLTSKRWGYRRGGLACIGSDRRSKKVTGIKSVD